MEQTSHTMTRRGFAKGLVAATTALGLVGAYEGGKASKAFAEESKQNAANQGTEGEVFGHCRMCMLCGCCGFTATTKDGVVVNIEGDPDRKTNSGGLCPRGKGAIMNLYNPYRIKAPMKRTNPEKGMDVDPGWVEISWDEALNTAAEKIGGCLATDPRTLTSLYGFAAYESSHATLGQGMWGHLVGTPNVSQVKGQMCAIHYGGMSLLNAVPTVNYDAKYDEYVVVMGKSLGYDNGYAGGDARSFADVVRRGGKFVVVGPYASMEASRGEWVPCKVASELPLVYAWLNYLLHEKENGYDKEFLQWRTNGVYLIGPDGEYVRGTDGKPQIWDAADATAKSFDDATLTDPALEGEYEVAGVQCRPGFTFLKEAVADFTPEWAEGISTVPAATIRRIADELVEHAHFGATINIDGREVPYRPACLVIGRGCTNQEVGTLIDVWSRVLNMLLGNPLQPGGIQGTMYTGLFPNEDGCIEPMGEGVPCTAETAPKWPPQALDYADFFPHKHSTQTFMWRVLNDLEKYGIEYKPSVMISSAANPVVGCDDSELVIEGLKKYDYVIYQACYHMDEMAMMSDLLLPEHANLEQHTCHVFPGTETTSTGTREDFPASNHAVVVRKGIDPLYDTMDGNDQLMEIFDRMGMTPVWNSVINMMGAIGFVAFNTIGIYPRGGLPFANPEIQLDPMKKYTAEEMFDLNLKSFYGEDKGLDYLDQVKFIPFDTQEGADLYPALRGDAEKLRFQLYFMSQKHSGEALLGALREIQKEHDIESLLNLKLDNLEKRYLPYPTYPDELLIDNEPAEFDLRAFTYRQPLFMFRLASMDQDPLRREYAEKYCPDSNRCLIHPETAAARGIAEGDEVIIESPYGKTQARAHVTEGVRPDALGVGGMRGRKTAAMGEDLLNDTNFNDLICGDFGHTDPIDAAEIIQVNVKVYKA